MISGRYLITGAGGFVGRALAQKLLSSGCGVVGLARGTYPDLERQGVTMVSGDLAALSASQLRGIGAIDGIFHVAAKVDMWGRYDDFFRTNVEGTRTLLTYAREAGITRFVFTSSPSVVSGDHDLCGVDEQIPYPDTFLASYPATKAIAEKEVLEANGRNGLKTLALRPHLIFGPGDTHFVPLILEKARKGKLIRVGDGENLVDLTYIEDCVDSHICGMQALSSSNEAAGRSYFISQGEPVELWEWVEEVVRRCGAPPIRRHVSKAVASKLAVVCEAFSYVMPWVKKPLLTRFLVAQMSTHHYFDISAAEKYLGFRPKWSMREAMDKTFPSSALKTL